MPADALYYWQGEDWEQFCFGLLQDRHGAVHVQRVPSKHKGDYGLDYYCRKEATAYQCYAVQEPVDVATRAKKQKNKITEDLKKFQENGSAISAIFGGVSVETWTLLVPLHDSADVNAHLGLKGKQVREACLPHVAGNFEANINDMGAFNSDLLSIRLANLQKIDLPLVPASDVEIKEFEKSEGALVENLSTKLLKRCFAGGFDYTGKKERYVAKFIERENVLDRLRSDSPHIYEAIKKAIDRRTEQLEMIGNPSDESASAIFKIAFQELVAEIEHGLPALTRASADAIALGTLSDWLMRCPLDFPPYDDAA
ncbi:hypothetical protein [Sphingosinicella sp. LY1275]|uniref:hypothetical protein n=1 Tax=Sphingosinicella sp. LY1275 TaxID=3095379 RepID=UPI002ADEC073|nr:hypothetical protein [Sphingosinicella sp. LY1275]MEA1013897.1 hypothetical protein [Sphingosinicella sp. LY1275]